MEGSGPFDVEGAEEAQRPPSESGAARVRDRPRRQPERPPRRRRAPRARNASSGSTGSETVARIAWAVPWIVFAVTVIVVGGGLFAAAMVLIASIAIVELYRMVPEARPLLPVAILATAGLVAAAFWGTHRQIVLVGTCAFPLMFAVAAMQRDRRGIVSAMAVTTFGIAWIAIPIAHAVLLRELPDHGAGLLVNVLVATFISDTAAYAGGRLFGRHRLAPTLSPNKTWEGLALGFVGGTMAFWFAGLYQDWLPGIDALLMGMCVAAIAPVGDLFESMVKRDLGVKDSGNALGPHGGILDRLDAVLFTIVVGYYVSLAFVF